MVDNTHYSVSDGPYLILEQVTDRLSYMAQRYLTGAVYTIDDQPYRKQVLISNSSGKVAVNLLPAQSLHGLMA
jgi:hypothetical protein